MSPPATCRTTVDIDMQATEHREQRPLIRTFLWLVKPHLSLTYDTHPGKRGREQDVEQTDCGVKGERSQESGGETKQ